VKFEFTREDLENYPLNEIEIKILTNLKTWRQDKSNEQNLPPYIIFTNNDLIAVTKYKPNDISQLYNIKGFGDTKIEKYGDDIISIINATI
jgi:DNA helicase-2/ATP-dependent DNA helicase PcrA